MYVRAVAYPGYVGNRMNSAILAQYPLFWPLCSLFIFLCYKRPSQTWGVCRPLVRAADRVEHRESGMIRVAMTYRLCSPPQVLDGLLALAYPDLEYTNSAAARAACTWSSAALRACSESPLARASSMAR